MPELLSGVETQARSRMSATRMRRRAKEEARRSARAKGHELGPFFRIGGGSGVTSVATCRRCRHSVSLPDGSSEVRGPGILEPCGAIGQTIEVSR